MSLEKSVFDALASLLTGANCDIDQNFDASISKAEQVVISVKVQQVSPGWPHWWALVDIIGATDIIKDKGGAKLDTIMGAVETMLEGLTVASFNSAASGVVLELILPDAPSDYNLPQGLESALNTRSKSIKLGIGRA